MIVLAGGSFTRDQLLARKRQADAVRASRARLRRQLGARELTIEVLLHEPPACLRTAPVFAVLTWVHRISDGFANRILRRANVNQTLLVGELGVRDRRAIVEAIRDLRPSALRKAAVGG